MTEPTHFTRLGKTGPAVFPIGLGCMGMSGIYGESDDDESVATIRAAVERGVTLFDTGDFYGMGHNELLVRRGLRGLARQGPDLGQVRRASRA
jgi:aryl-alcohol dehydrogenase-like predicted oxidoreductase